MDLQRSLAILESRYRQLLELADIQFDELQKEKSAALKSVAELKEQLSAQAEKLAMAEKVREEETIRSESLAVELSLVKNELDVTAKEKSAALKSVGELKEQFCAQAEKLAMAEKVREEEAVRSESLAVELSLVKNEWDATAKEKSAALKSVGELKEQLCALAEKLAMAEKVREEEAVRSESLVAELSLVKNEWDATAKEKSAALKSVAELKEQLCDQSQKLEQAQTACDDLTHQRQRANDDAELMLIQLHQVQEELEHYFLQARGADQLAAAHQDQLLRAQALMARLLPEASASAPAQRVAVEVLPPSPPGAPVQTEALLSSYASSLRRASALLHRAIQR